MRAERPASRDALVAFLDKLFTDRVLEGALSSSDLTFKELETVKQTFIHILQGVHHPRVRYPEKKGPPVANPDNGGTGGKTSDADVGQISPPTAGWGTLPPHPAQPGSESQILTFSGQTSRTTGGYARGEF